MTVELDTPFKVQAGAYMKRVMVMWLSRHAWWLLLLLAACISLCVIYVKWSVIAFILYLAALMMGLSLVYFNYAFSPLGRWSVMEKTATIDAVGIHFTFEHPKMNDHTIEWGEVARIDFRAEATLFHLKGATINFVMLPPLTPEQVTTIKQLYLNY